MKVLAVSDVHGAVEQLEAILAREDDYDLVLVAGDITDTSLEDYDGTAEAAMKLLDSRGRFVKAVPGNMDDERILKLLIGNRVNLHKNVFSLRDYEFIGFGGGRTPGGGTPFEPDDSERGEVLKQLIQRRTADNLAVVSHEPPKNTSADLTSSGEHVGSEALRGVMEDEDINLVLCGHIHEAVSVEEVGGTTVVNPGPVTEGRYAVLELEDGVDVDLRGL